MKHSFELSSKKYKNGRRKFSAVLYKLQPPDSVVDGIGTKYNYNGITFLEEYSSDKLDSIKDMSVTVSFLDDERTQILDHGFTETTDDGLPTFDDATVVGHFTNGYIKDIEINGVNERCVCGDGFLDEMRYHAFVEKLETDLSNGASIEGSIEIYRDENHNAIEYLNGWIEKGRIPTSFIHSGWSMVLNPADPNSQLLELNNKQIKEENQIMEFTEEMKLAINNAVSTTINELNNKESEFNGQIEELNSIIADKDAVITQKEVELNEKETKISELNASVEQLQAALDQLKADHETYWAERDLIEKELVKAKVEKKLGEMTTALGEFSEAEQSACKEEIEECKNKIESCEKTEDVECMTSEINSLVAKLYQEIGKAKKQADADAIVAEQNAALEQNEDMVDIFSEICSEEVNEDEEEDLNIF